MEIKKYKIICICQIYNELEKGNLRRFFKYIKPLVDEIIIYDDGSTDGSYEYCQKHANTVIRNAINNFTNEVRHRAKLLEKAKKRGADFVLWLDADEVITSNAQQLQKACDYCKKNMLDGLVFHEINLWRSNSWQRLDSLYNDGWFTRLWRIKTNTRFNKTKKGLHQSLVPDSIKKIIRYKSISVIHFGFVNDLNIAYKYFTYKKHGQRGYIMLDRLISEEKLVVKPVSPKLFPGRLYKKDPTPTRKPFIESVTAVQKYRSIVERPKYSIACLVYKSTQWLQFVYNQVLKYTDLKDKEFYFVANDATPEVIKYLKNNYIPHYVFRNSEKQKKEWYINNVYRAWNFAAQKARGDYIVFINSDMAFTPKWLENLTGALNGSNCVASRLVESGKLRSGTYGIEKNFGRVANKYKENSFQTYACTVQENVVKDGGLFMPLLIKKKDFINVGGYPEGNVKAGSDIFSPTIAKQNENLISGDVVLMQKLATIGVKHQTSFSSLVYHFQCGEMDSKRESNNKEKTEIAICNDLVTGTMGERVLWDFLLESLPGAYGLDKRVVGEKGKYELKARRYISKYKPETDLIIQNASFINRIDNTKPTIAFLQDDLRAMGKTSTQQDTVLKFAQQIVTNSFQTALSYPEFDCEVIPVGVDEKLFRPKNKKMLREKYGFSTKKKIGIFVGSLNSVKGWPEVKACIKKFPTIDWIVVTKHKEFYSAKNVFMYSRIDQKLLSDLYSCADFFIIGSKVETQCLAAVEACLCNTPVVMHNVGIFK
ncbi:MAG TPA: glycosyltransferase, partial [bacterium]|nr:glycosyltransferase [bacterium]